MAGPISRRLSINYWGSRSWAFMGLDQETKVIPSYVVGKGDLSYARLFPSLR
jgi:hypothetical protein